MDTPIQTDTAMDRPTGRRRLLLAFALVALAAVVLVVALRPGGQDGPLAGPADGETVEAGDVQLTGAQLTSLEDGIDPATGLPTDERSSYERGEGARLWVQFTYTGDEPGRDSLFVRWYRDGEEVFSSAWRLPQPVENHNVALGAAETEEPGAYRVEVLVNDEVLRTINFEVE